MPTKTKIALAVIGWATVSCALSLSVLLPTNLHADGAADIAARGEIDNPKLVVDGVELRIVRLDSTTPIVAGKPLAVTLVAKNTSAKPITVTPTVVLLSSPPVDRRSRVVPIATQIWQRSPTITLSAGETKSIAVTDSPNLAADSSCTVMLQNGSASAVVMRFTAGKS